MNFQVISQKTLFQGKVFNLRQDTLQFEDGRRFQLDVIEHGGAVTFIPMESDQSIWLVRQYRHAVAEELLELPAGGLNPGEPPEIAVKRECREEVGLAPGRVIRLGQAYLAPGYSSELLHFYMAFDLQPSPLPQDEDEVLTAEQFTWQQAMDMLHAGQFSDAKTVVGLTLASYWLESQG
jgi:ADP-ribose pyrophosphatase